MLLTDPTVDPGAENNMAVQLASQAGHTEVVSMLLTHPKADPCTDDNNALLWVLENGQADVVSVLLANSRVDPGARTTILYAVHQKMITQRWFRTCWPTLVGSILALQTTLLRPSAPRNARARGRLEGADRIVLLTVPRVGSLRPYHDRFSAAVARRWLRQRHASPGYR